MRKIYIKTIAALFVMFAFTGNIKAVDYYLKSSGTITLLSSWGVNPDGSGANPPSFSGNNVWHFANRTAATLTGIFTPPNTATASIESGFNLSVSGAGTINSKIDIAATGGLIIINNKTYNLNNLDANSTVTYSASTAAVRPAYYGNLVIAVSTSLNGALSPGFPFWVYGTLTINSSRTLTMNGYGISLNGSSSSIAGAGTITGDAAAYIELVGGNGGNNGTLNFTPGSAVLNYLYIQYTGPSDNISLGSDLLISGGYFFQFTGSINLNGKILTVDNASDASFATVVTDGYVTGSASSQLLLQGTIGSNSGTTDLFMDPSNNILGVLNLNSSGQTLSAGNALVIADSLSIQAGTFNTNSNVTLRSTSTLKGRLAKLTGTLNGNLTVQTFALGGSTGWAQLGISGISGQTFNNWYGQIPMAIEGSATGVTSAGGYYFESVQGWDETNSNGYDTTITVSSAITPGKGYWVYLGNGATSTTDMTWNVSGTPVTGNVNIPLSSSAQAGFNLIANPYASPISWTKLRNANSSVNNATYIYNADGPYVTFVNGVGTNGGNDVIAMGQGFYVEATGATNLTATEDVKVEFNTNANQLLKGSSSSPSQDLVFKLKVNGPNSDYDETAFRFNSVATPSFDVEWDAHKIFQTPGYAGYPGGYSKYTTISSKGGNEDYSINSLPVFTSQNVSIPVLVKVMTTGTYTISPLNIQNFTNPSCVILKDKLLNVNHVLANGPYVCTISDTTSTARFELNICAQSMPTSVSNQAAVNDNILISQDQSGAFVKTNFLQNTKAVISVYNIIGQQLINDITVEGTESLTHLNLNVHNQVVLIRVTTDKESVVKKVVVH